MDLVAIAVDLVAITVDLAVIVVDLAAMTVDLAAITVDLAAITDLASITAVFSLSFLWGVLYPPISLMYPLTWSDHTHCTPFISWKYHLEMPLLKLLSTT